MSDKNLTVKLSIDADGNVKGVLTDVNRDLDKFKAQADKASTSSKQLSDTLGSVKAIGLTVFAGWGVSEIAGQVLDVTKEFQSLKASLVTVTGSAALAEQEFAAIQKIVKETPYQLSEYTDAFIKMQSLGIDASERAMTAYGDTASSMGKSLNQMIDAVADAATGEFERLRDFGIRAKTEGDKIRFIYKGVETEVKNTSEDIQKYMIKLGETNFAGGMSRQMDTLTGQLSNLQDSWDAAFFAIGSSNNGAISSTISALDSLADAVRRVFTNTEELRRQSAELQQSLFGKTDVDYINAYNDEIRNAQSEIQTLQASIEQLKPYMSESTYAVDTVKAYESQIESLTTRIDELRSKAYSLNGDPTNEIGSVEAEIKRVYEKSAEFDKEQAKLKEILSAQLAKIDGTEAERRAKTIASMNSENAAIQQKIYAINDETKAKEAWNTEADKELDLIEEKQRLERETRIDAEETSRNYRIDAQWEADNRDFDKADQKDKLLESMAALTDQTSLYGDAWTRTGNQAIDAMSSMLSVMDKVGQKDKRYRDELAKATTEEAKKSKEYKELEQARIQNSISGTAAMLDASVALYSKGSEAQRAAHQASLAMHAIEISMQAEKALTAATLAVLGQGDGDPYTAFARMGAMAVMVGGVLSQIGVSFGIGASGSSGLSSMGMAGPDGSPIGSTDPSKSLSNSLEFMRDIEADQYNELRGIYNEMVDLNSNITSVVSSLLRTGDLTGLGAYGGKYSYQGQDVVNTLSGIGIHNALENLPGIGGSVFGFANDFGSGLAQTIASGLFGSTKKSVSDYGLSAGAFRLGGDLDLRKYTTIKTKKDGGWFGKSKTSYSTNTGDISGESERLLNLVFDDLRDGMIAAGDALDRNVQSQVDNFVIRLGTISTKDKTGDQIAEQLSNAISAQSDKLAYSVYGDLVRSYGQLNEGAMETVYRLVTDKAVTGNLLSKTNQSWGSGASGVAADAIAVSQALIGLAGSLKDLQSAGASYYDNFFSDAEKQADNLSYLTEALAAQNLVLPENADAYKRLVESLNLGTAAAQSQYYTLLDLNDVAAKYYDYQAQQSDAYKSDLLEARANLLKDEASATESTISQLKNLYSVLDSTYSAIIGSVTPDQAAYTNAQTTVSDALASAKIGNFPDVSDISDALSVLANNNASNYANYSDYQYDQLMSANMVQELMGYTSDQITVEDQMLDQMTTQVDYLSQIANNTADYTVLQVQAAIDGSHEAGLAYVPKDGYRAELHHGESVIDATTMRGLRKYGISTNTSNGNANLIAEIRRLEQAVSKLSSENKALLNSIKSNTEKSYKLHREWDFSGIPETRQLGVSNV